MKILNGQQSVIFLNFVLMASFDSHGYKMGDVSKLLMVALYQGLIWYAREGFLGQGLEF